MDRDLSIGKEEEWNKNKKLLVVTMREKGGGRERPRPDFCWKGEAGEHPPLYMPRAASGVAKYVGGRVGPIFGECEDQPILGRIDVAY